MDEQLRDSQKSELAIALYDYSIMLRNCGTIALIHQFLMRRPTTKAVLSYCERYGHKIN